MNRRIHRALPATAFLISSCLAAQALAAATSSGLSPNFPGQQQVLATVSERCSPWNSSCAPSRDAKIGKDEGFVKQPDGETWVERAAPDGKTAWTRCTSTACDLPVACPSPAPPCQAQKERENREKTDKAFQAANDDGRQEDVAGKAVDDILKGQPENSLLVPDDSGSADAPVSDWSGLYSTMQSLSGIGEADDAGISRKSSAINDALLMRKQARQIGASDPSLHLDPAYRNSKTLK
jgi:hypothetical protein